MRNTPQTRRSLRGVPTHHPCCNIHRTIDTNFENFRNDSTGTVLDPNLRAEQGPQIQLWSGRRGGRSPRRMDSQQALFANLPAFTVLCGVIEF